MTPEAIAALTAALARLDARLDALEARVAEIDRVLEWFEKSRKQGVL